MGRLITGENNPTSKLTNQLVKELRQLYKSNPNLTMTELGKCYGVGRETARKVIRRLAW
ncbi:MAG: hypothetical protein ABIB11_05055 [Candidatus Omnitrophota bacterium]